MKNKKAAIMTKRDVIRKLIYKWEKSSLYETIQPCIKIMPKHSTQLKIKQFFFKFSSFSITFLYLIKKNVITL